MSDEDPENDQIADIYQRMVHGDRNALAQLQRVQKSPPKKKKSQLIAPQSPDKNNEYKESKQLNTVRKSENFRSYVKEKVNELRNAKQGSKKQLVQPDIKTDQKEFRQRKPFSMQKRKNEKGSEKIVTAETQSKLPKPPSIVSSVPKPKTTNNFQEKINKQIIKDKDEKSSPPSSKNSFRVRPIGGNKKLIEELLRINENQKMLQAEILDLHNRTKQQIEQTVTKYKIAQLQKSRFTVISTFSNKYQENIDNVQDLLSPSPQRDTLSGIIQKSAYIKTQQQKIEKLEKELAQINKELSTKKTQIQKSQAKIQLSPLYAYLNVVPDIFEARESQEENQQVHQLPQKAIIQQDPHKTYHSVMNQRKKKNWGLSKRINYDYQTVKNESRITKQDQTQNQAPFINRNTDDGQNKVTVNSRLKQFLFD